MRQVAEGYDSSADEDQMRFDNNLSPVWRHTGTIEAASKTSVNHDKGVRRKWHLRGLYVTDIFRLKCIVKLKPAGCLFYLM